ncbi:MAG: transglycosylase SLT domain-containing protein [Candidatus Beckwithbacteria bacterium]|nr:transglycosylase SLT domain-containing protein [Candidatus Beckwithbacteria bacterium]
MKQRRHIYFGMMLIIFLASVYFFMKPKPKQTFLSPLAAQDYNSSPSPSPTPSPIASLKPSLSPQPSFVPLPSPAVSQEINAFIDKFSAQYGVNPNVLRHLAICESGFNSRAKNGIYAGLFQFSPATWKNIRQEIGKDTNPNLRFSAEESVQTAAYILSQGKESMWPNCVTY